MRLLTVLIFVFCLFGCAHDDAGSLRKQIIASDCMADQECESLLKYYGRGLDDDMLSNAAAKVFEESVLIYTFEFYSARSSVFYFAAHNCEGDAFFREIENNIPVYHRDKSLVLDNKSCALFGRIVKGSYNSTGPGRRLVSSHPVPVILKRCVSSSGETICVTDYFRNGNAGIFRFMNRVITDLE